MWDAELNRTTAIDAELLPAYVEVDTASSGCDTVCLDRFTEETSSMKLVKLATAVLLAIASVTVDATAQARATDSIPLPEHPRPDFERAEWLNLNGHWQFAFDAKDQGEKAGWFRAGLPSPKRILVPFSWGAPLSGVADSADIGWYARTITIPERWRGRRVYLVVGASDWRTSVWLDGTKVGEHQGGYTPFSVELTAAAKAAGPHRLTLRVDDTTHPFKLEGKQGYGKARGIWQTVYLEARGDAAAPGTALHARHRPRRGQGGRSPRRAPPSATSRSASP